MKAELLAFEKKGIPLWNVPDKDTIGIRKIAHNSTDVSSSTNTTMTTPFLNMVVQKVWSLMIVGKFVFGLHKPLHVMAVLKFDQFHKIHMFVVKKVSLLIPKTADGSLLASITKAMVI